MLAQINHHERDIRISFEEYGHKYTIDGDENEYTSVTTFIKQYFDKFDVELVSKRLVGSTNEKYAGKSQEEIKNLWTEAAKLGTEMHKTIEHFYNKEYNKTNLLEKLLQPMIEMYHFLSFYLDYNFLTPYRTEWLIYDEENKIAGSIDALFKYKDEYIIMDWKRSENITKTSFKKSEILGIDDCNYNHYCLQLNMYRYILKTKYNILVTQLYLVQIHPKYNNYILIPIPIVEDVIIFMLNIKKY